MENVLYWFIDGQTHLGIPGCAKMSLAFNKPHKIVALHSETTPKHPPQVERDY